MEHILVQFMSQITFLTDEERKAIIESFPIMDYEKGHLLLKEGMIANDAFYVINGCIREYKLVDGLEITTAFYTKNQSAINFISQANNIPSDKYFECTEWTSVAVLNSEKEKMLYKKHPRFERFCREGMEQMMGAHQNALKILIIGGTNFIGRNLIEKLSLNETFDLTIFNRGITNPDLFPHVKRIIGDRNSDDINLIHQIKWDYIIDLACYFPQSIINILGGLSSNLKKYIFISTCSVYQDFKVKNGNENALTKTCNSDQFVDKSTNSYGNRKAECERIIESSNFNYTILRPGLIYGKYDHTDRFYYWLHQAKMYHEILVPNNGKSQISLTYVNGLVKTIEKTIVEQPDRDAYNITTVNQTSIEQILKYALEVLANKPQLINASSEFLKTNHIEEWSDMPVWVDSEFSIFNNQKVVNKFDLKFEEFRTSVKESIQYYGSLGWPNPSYGMTREKQISLIDKIVG